MAEKKAKMSTDEKIYNIPLRSSYKSGTRIERTKKSVKAVKEYVTKHTHTPEVRISEKLNTTLWSGGAKKPLHKITVKVTISEGTASVRLPDEITLAEEKKKFLDKKDEKAEEKPDEAVKEEPEAEVNDEQPVPEDKKDEAPSGEEKK
ncbi:MAG: 60S ribosomal protein L31 [Candidatus Aenigmarchaeota archaeon]|nr:60S ribosomal protein L31 [Candidatus Aenigmarchaeota archaeon]